MKGEWTMKNRKKSWWAYRFTYRLWSAPPKEINIFKFTFHFLLSALAWGFYWLGVGSVCFLFAWKRAKNEEDFFVPINKWPTLLGFRILPISVIGLGFIAWPFIFGFDRWRNSTMAMLGALFSLIAYFYFLTDKETRRKISERTKIVFTENGKA
jgi:hypothetical protein